MLFANKFYFEVLLIFDNECVLRFNLALVRKKILQIRRFLMTLQRALLLLVLMMGLGLMFACGDDDDDVVDSGPDADADTDADCNEDCGDAGILAADGGMYSCRANSYGSDTCTDFPSATWTSCCAVESCAASAEDGNGQIDGWGSSDCAADNFPTDWRCDATSDGTATVPLYYVYAQALPQGICGGPLLGTVVERDGDTWQSY
jgi:hypothetical protein